MTVSKANIIAKGISLYQILGAVFGLVLCYYALYNYQLNLFWWVFILIAISFQLFFLIAGVKLFQLKSIGFTLTLYSQLFQLVFIYLLGFTYMNASGIGLFVGINLTNSIEFAWQFAYTSIMKLGKTDPALQVVYINFVPLILIYLLERSKKARESSVNFEFAK